MGPYTGVDYNVTLSHSCLWGPNFHPKDKECLPIYQPVGKGRVKERGRVTVANSQKVLPKSSNVAVEKMRWQEKFMVEIRHNFIKSGRIFFNNHVIFWKFYFKYKEPNRMFIGIICFENWKNFSYKWRLAGNLCFDLATEGGKGSQLALCLRIDILWSMGNPRPELTLTPIHSWL